jgi:hypothetical protein
MTEDHVASGEEKLLMVAQQMDVSKDTPTQIHCPYCGGLTSEGEIFCCDTIIRALNAIADARDRFGIRR